MAPSTGKVFISGDPYFTSGNTNTFNTDFRIVLIPPTGQNDARTLWEVNDYQKSQPLSHRLTVDVNEGDKIYFLALAEGTNNNVRITWDPKIYTVPDSNVAPVFPAISEQKAKAGYSMNFSVEATDENFDVLSYSSSNLPQGAKLNSKTGEVTWIPTEAQTGSYDIDFTVSDGKLTAATTVKVNVEKIPLQKIEITSKPVKTEYLTGDPLDLNGLVVTGTFQNGDRITFTDITLDNISGFNSEITGSATQTLTVNVKGLTASFPVKIVSSPLIPRFSYRTLIKDGSGTVKVNQEVLFTAEESSYNGVSLLDVTTAKDQFVDAKKDVNDGYYKDENQLMGRAHCEWDFGDGYAFDGIYNGSAVTHYYMRSGTFTITLTVKVYDLFDGESRPLNEPLHTRKLQKTITVTGVEPLEDFELYHAPFTSRIAQFIIPNIPDNVAADSSNRLLVTLTGDNNTNLTLLDTKNLQEVKKFLLEQRNLKKGIYTLTAKLLDRNGNIITNGEQQGIWSETFEKKCDGIPDVGIDEWNAICLKGEPFLPVTPYMLNTDKIPAFEGCINTLDCVGWYPSVDQLGYASVGDYRKYLELAENKGLMVIGPTRGQYSMNRRGRNYNTQIMQEYAKASAEYDSFLMHDWRDEPNLGGNHLKVFPPSLSSFKFICDEVDGEHPVFMNLYGFDYLEYKNPYKGTAFDYAGSTRFNARHTFYVDVVTSDVYPMHFRTHATLFNQDRGIMDLWTESLDNLENNNMGLIPRGTFIEVCKVKNDRPGPAPTSEQVLMECWLAITHGAKIINHFTFFDYSTMRYDAMREFMTAMNTYDKIILGPSDVEQIADDSNVRMNRVDTLTRKDGDDTYLFSIRLTEPDPIEGEDKHLAYPEPETITTTFTVPDKTSKTAYVQDETGKVIRQIPVIDGKFTDTFGKEEYHIYKITSDKADIVPGDVDGNGKVDISDLAMVAKNFDKSSTSSDWSKVRSADVNNDNIINLNDIAFIARMM